VITRDACARADAADPLAGFRTEFALPEGVVYLDGNSLGARPRAAAEVARRVVEQEWGEDLIGSWNAAGWFDLPVRLGERLGPLIGAEPGTCVVTDTTTHNLHQVLAAALRIATDRDPARRVVVSERDNFPTDLYVAQGLIAHLDRGHELRLVDDEPGLAAALGPDVAVVMLSHVNYRTGAMWEMLETTARAQAAGALVIWDLAHSAGAVPVDLTGAGADFAVGCSYKYLNGGPGAPAFLWVHPRHLATYAPPTTGWWGHAAPFAMETDFRPADGVRRLLGGTQPIVSLALVGCGLDITARAGMAALRHKSLALGDRFCALVAERCADHPLRLVTPREPARRGSQICLEHPEGYAVMQALIERGVVGDYREPGILRFGIAPLYLRHVDVFDAVTVLAEVLDSGVWDDDHYRRRAAVT
jgi:kynureninase